MAEEIIFYFRKTHFPAGFLTDGCHTYSSQTTGIDPRKGRKVKVDIQSQTVKGYAVADGDAYTAELFVPHPDPVVARIAVGDNPACRR